MDGCLTIIDMIFLENVIGLALKKGTGNDPERLVGRARNAQLVAHFLEIIATRDVLDRRDRIAVVVEIIKIIRKPADAFIIGVVGIGVINIIIGAGVRPMHVRTRVGYVEVADLAFNRQSILRKFIAAWLFPESLRLQITKPFIESPDALGL